MKRSILLSAIISFLFLATLGFAQNVDTVMVVTDMTNVDAAIATAAASKSGIPVFITENGLLTTEIKAELAASSVNNVILVGGPVVIKPEVESELRASGYNVIRLWGLERTGTGVAVSKYFWNEGASCAVLADDTKNNEADAYSQLVAADLAARMNCIFIPVPQGTVPGDVLAVLRELDVKNIHFVGKNSYAEVRNNLRGFNLKEYFGSDDEIRTKVRSDINATQNLTLLIVATPDWKGSLIAAAHPNARAYVIHKANADDISDILSFINNRTISEVRIVGVPSIADSIAEKITGANVTVIKISGERISLLSKDLFTRQKDEWHILKIKQDQNDLRFRTKMKIFLENDVNLTISRLNTIIAELNALENSTDVANAKIAIEEARSRLLNITRLLQSGNIDEARRLLYEIKFKADERRYQLRDNLKLVLEDEVRSEERNINDALNKVEEMLSSVESRLSEVREGCENKDIIDALKAKATSLRIIIQEYKNSGNFTGAAPYIDDVRELTRMAHSVSEICRKHGRLDNLTIVDREKMPEIEIRSPTEGSVVAGSRVVVELDVDDFKLVPPTSTVNVLQRKEGHIHVFLDGIEQIGPQKRFVFNNVSTGSHTIRAELHLSNHANLTPAVYDQINIIASGPNATAECDSCNYSQMPRNYTIEITSSGFSPNAITIKKGETVTFVNKDNATHWPASAMHPTHTVYPGSSIEKCDTAERNTIFDACEGLDQNETFSFTFNEVGKWNYHDHLVEGRFGSITVQQV